MAYIKYSLGKEPEELRGNERYLWPVIQAGIERSKKRTEIYRENGKKRFAQQLVSNCSAIGQQTPLSPVSAPDGSSSSSPPHPPISISSLSPNSSPCEPPILSKAAERFARLWEMYPRKQGRKSAFESYKRAIRDGATDEEIERGIKAYTEYCQGKDTQYIKQGSTFFSQRAWEDEWKKGESWIDRIDFSDIDNDFGAVADSGEDFAIVLPESKFSVG